MLPTQALAASVLLALCFSTSAFAAEEYSYTARNGDTLIGIADRLLIEPGRWPRLQRLNRIADPRHILPGTVILIPLAMMRQAPAEAKVLQAQGDTDSDGEKLQPGMTLGEGRAVRTGKNISVTLQLGDGTRLTLQPQSQMRLERLKTYPGTGIYDSGVRLDSGRVESAAAKQRGGARYEVRTPLALAAVRGTNFRVSADAEQARSEVLEGRVAVSGAQAGTKSVNLNAGFGTVVDSSQQPLPPVALLGAPETGSLPKLQERVLMRFKLPALAEATAYRGQIAADRSFQAVLAEATFKSPEVRFGDLPDGDYVLRVRGIDKLGLEGKDAHHAFKLKARPEPPFLSAPQNKGKLRGEAVEFKWAEAAEAANYHFQLAQDAQFSKLVLEEKTLAKTRFLTPGKTVPGDYHWRIASIRANGERGPWGDAQTFSLKPPPAQPEPPAIDDKSIAFTWSGEPGQTFRFQLARDDKFTQMVSDQTKLAEPRVVLARTDESGAYYMRIQATDPDGYVGPFTSPQKFEVPHPPFPWWLLLIFLPAL